MEKSMVVRQDKQLLLSYPTSYDYHIYIVWGTGTSTSYGGLARLHRMGDLIISSVSRLACRMSWRALTARFALCGEYPPFS